MILLVYTFGEKGVGRSRRGPGGGGVKTCRFVCDSSVPTCVLPHGVWRKQETLTVRRGSEVIYTFHGLSNTPEAIDTK